MKTVTILSIEFKALSSKSNEPLQKMYYYLISEFLLLEAKNKELLENSNKRLYYYLKYDRPTNERDYFLYLYNVFSPIRYFCETIDSITELKNDIRKILDNYKEN